MMLRGLSRWWQQDRRKTLGYLAVLILFPLPYYFSHSSPDYRQPIEPMVMTLVTIGIFGVRDWIPAPDDDQLIDDASEDFEDPAEGLDIA
jgi:hypothetical protein